MKTINFQFFLMLILLCIGLKNTHAQIKKYQISVQGNYLIKPFNQFNFDVKKTESLLFTYQNKHNYQLGLTLNKNKPKAWQYRLNLIYNSVSWEFDALHLTQKYVVFERERSLKMLGFDAGVGYQFKFKQFELSALVHFRYYPYRKIIIDDDLALDTQISYNIRIVGSVPQVSYYITDRVVTGNYAYTALLYPELNLKIYTSKHTYFNLGCELKFWANGKKYSLSVSTLQAEDNSSPEYEVVWKNSFRAYLNDKSFYPKIGFGYTFK